LLPQRSILVTGCSSGIGAYCARALKHDGWRVFATARKPRDLDTLEREGFETFYLDYTEPPSVERVAAAVLDATGGRLGALFNNGGYAQAGAVEDMPMEALRAQFEANFFGWHDLTRRIVPAMRAQRAGRVVLNSSIYGLVPGRFRGAYVASKFAVEGLMTSMALELAGSGVHVSVIEPGPVTSRIAANALPWFERYIDTQHSAHAEAYRGQLRRLSHGGTASRLKLGPEAVYKALRHALESERPRPHYPVTVPAKAGALMRRFLPARLLYRVLAGRD
jgi:NAD(P)-dependent dehydrogenase (short-subunit alcohol dehydrogenase family)